MKTQKPWCLASSRSSRSKWIKINLLIKITTECGKVEFWPFPPPWARGRHCLHHQKFLVRLLCEAGCPCCLVASLSSLSLCFLDFCFSASVALAWLFLAGVMSSPGQVGLGVSLVAPPFSLEDNVVSLVPPLAV